MHYTPTTAPSVITIFQAVYIFKWIKNAGNILARIQAGGGLM